MTELPALPRNVFSFRYLPEDSERGQVPKKKRRILFDNYGKHGDADSDE